MIAAAERIIPAALADADERALHWTRYETAVPLAAGRRVLDMACGVGYGTARLAARAATALGADVSVAAVTQARVLYRETGARFTVADATRLPFESDSPLRC